MSFLLDFYEFAKNIILYRANNIWQAIRLPNLSKSISYFIKKIREFPPLF